MAGQRGVTPSCVLATQRLCPSGVTLIKSERKENCARRWTMLTGWNRYPPVRPPPARPSRVSRTGVMSTSGIVHELGEAQLPFREPPLRTVERARSACNAPLRSRPPPLELVLVDKLFEDGDALAQPLGQPASEAARSAAAASHTKGSGAGPRAGGRAFA